MKVGHCLSQAAWSSRRLSFLQVAHLNSAHVARHPLVGCSFAQLAHVSFDLHVAAVCPAPISWHLKQCLGSSSSFLASWRVLSMSRPLPFALFLCLIAKTACAFVWVGFQLAGFLNHLTLAMDPLVKLFSVSISVCRSSRRFLSLTGRNCTTT